MGGERLLIIRTKSQAQQTLKDELRPCCDCKLDPASCNKQYVSEVPERGVSVLCSTSGMVVEMRDLSVQDQTTRIIIPRRNGESRTGAKTPDVQAAAL